MAKMWNSEKPTKCQICEGPLQEFFVDGRTHFGYWCIMCLGCVDTYGTGLGTGCGQLYKLDNLHKVAG